MGHFKHRFCDISPTARSNYLKARLAFSFPQGRVAQRAVHSTLRATVQKRLGAPVAEFHGSPEGTRAEPASRIRGQRGGTAAEARDEAAIS